MIVNKPYLEFHAVDVASGWEPVGPDRGVEQKILAGGLDEANRTGSVTRLLRMLPGTITSEVLRHEFWEEVFVMSGDYRIIDKVSGETVQEFPSGGAYAVSSTRQGPWTICDRERRHAFRNSLLRG